MKRTWVRALLGFVILFGITALWAVTTPKYAAPDEPAHAVKAAANVRGEFRGTPQPADHIPYEAFTVPATLAQGNPACIAFQPEQSAACLPRWTAQSGMTEALTYVGGYPPLYYLLVGLPTLVTNGKDVLFWMRLVSAALSSLFLAVGFVAASRIRRARWTVLGVAAAVTPMALFLASVVNPSGLEISAALATWTCALAAFASREDPPPRGLVLWTAVSASVLVQVRGLSPLLLAVIGLTVVGVTGWQPVLRVLRRRDGQIGAGILAASSIFALVWIFAMGSLKLAGAGQPVAPNASNWQIFTTAIRAVGLNMYQLFGVFGWLDTNMPTWCYFAWEAICALLALAVLVRREFRLAVVIAGVVAVTILLPTALASLEARKLGIVGQGRYILPVAVGAPILAGYAMSRRPRGRRARARRLLVPALIIGVTVGAVQVSGFVQALHRYRTGVNAPLFVRDTPWNPPIAPLIAVGLFVVLQAVFLWWWLSLPVSAGPENRETPNAARTPLPAMGE